MNKISFDLYEGACEPFSLKYDASLIAELDFYPPRSGYIMISDRTYKVSSGKCTADLKYLDDGEHTPYFYAEDTMYSMPTLIKKGKKIRFDPDLEEFIYKTAARCRFAAKRIQELEGKIAELTKKIEGSKLSIGDIT